MRKSIPERLLMCSRHWKLVPAEIQRRVWKAYRGRPGGAHPDSELTREYSEAVREAILAVESLERAEC
jgi:hypothetical protein